MLPVQALSKLRADRRGMSGVSLLEALVALAVMAFGILGVVGVQTTLRANGDVSRQRAEAVRIAEETIETWRSFTVLTMPPAPTPHNVGYDQLVTAPSTTVAGTTTTYTVTQTVSTIAAPAIKSLQVDVTWQDRAGANQQVTMTTRITGVLPETSGSLSITPRSLTGTQFYGRNAAIPTSATNQGSSSAFTPPGAATGVSWVFSNATGLITSICTAPGVCPPANAALLSGAVRYALTSSQPTGADAEVPPALPGTMPSGPAGGPALAPATLGVKVVTTLPTAATILCYSQWVAAYTATLYYCAIPLPATPPYTWSGYSAVDAATAPVVAASSPPAGSTTSPNYVRVCRYTSDPTTDTPPGGNPDHPLDYAVVTTSLTQQNFLVIRAGNGGSAFNCPTDGTGASAFIDGDTRAHQPPR